MDSNNNHSHETDLVSVVLYRFLPYWPLFLILAGLGVIGALAYLRYTIPLYESTASIIIKDEKKGVDDSKILDALNAYASKKNVENEIEVIRSRKLMQQVVAELHLYTPVFEKGNIHAIPLYNNAPVAIMVKSPDRLESSKDISFTLDKGQIVFDQQSYPLDKWVITPYGELMFVTRNNKKRDPKKQLFFQLLKPKEVATSILKRIDVSASSKLSSVVNISLRDEISQRGDDILNELITKYNQSSIDDKNQLAANTLVFVEGRLETVESELDSLERKIQHYRSNNGAINLSEQGRVFLENVGENDKKIADVNMKLAVLDQVERYVVSKDNHSSVVPSTLGVDNPALTQLVQKLYSAELEYEKLRKTTGENNPMALAVSSEIQQIRPSILENLHSERASLQAGITNLSSTDRRYNSALNAIPQKERELTEISREQAVKNGVYNFLLEKREQTGLAISSTVSDSKIVDFAESSDRPVSPKRLYVLLAAFAIAMAIGIALVTVREFLNRKILFRSEIEKYTKVPVVAEITYTKKKEALLTSNVSVASEQFRQLRAAIGLYGHNASKKKLLVTSSISGEGKSYISTNLAMSLALAGKKVVLVDLDIRNPKSSSALGIVEEAGVAEFLEGTKRPDEIIRTTDHKNLNAISAGAEIENARELILTGKLRELLDYLEGVFDFVIMDTSPVDPVTDAYVFSEFSDTTLFVVRHRYTPKALVQVLDENQKIRSLKNPFIVFNDVRSRGLFKKTYGYGYGYGYQNVYRERTGRGKKTNA
jgi:tyrosine-protein kinase Etk/Wzc